MQKRPIREDVNQTLRQCAICHMHYRHGHNLGTWKCFQHGGVIADGRWTCCNTPAPRCDTIQAFYRVGRANDEKGCVRADHRPTFAPFTASSGRINVPDKWYKFMRREKMTNPEAHVDEKDGKHVVRRYDAAEADRLATVMLFDALGREDPAMKEYVVTGSVSQKRRKIDEQLELI